MSGNLWMFSDKLDDEDIEILKHEFITYYQGADYYGLGLKMFTRLAHEAGAVYKIGKKVLIRRTIFDEYLRKLYRIEQEEEARKTDGKEASMRRGTLVLRTESGRMDIRFNLDEYHGELLCGTRMDVLIDEEWVPTRIEMADDWFLVGIDTENITRAYISHGWNCKHCRNCQYACRGALIGPPVVCESKDRIRGPCIHNRQTMRRFTNAKKTNNLV